ncbi:MAG: AAA family ATPase [Candidatus Omnitrophica bacterium]|nr:AAA family ATPase [Candidatus Omnitrophota bacterium]
MQIEITEQFQQAIDLIEHGNKNVFITGRAGTGKSTLLRYLRTITYKKAVVLAPTGVSALNVQGQTIHSFFRFKPDITLDKVKKIVKNPADNIYQKLDTVIIDEISMVRADILDCVDRFMRLNCSRVSPFAGKQMVFFGDPYQLPPVITPTERKIFKGKYSSGYFFSADVMKEISFDIVELDRIFRQTDEGFIRILNSIRNNTVTDTMLDELNTRCMPEFEPDRDSFFISLTTKNDKALAMNERRLAKLQGKEYTFEAEIKGKFEKAAYPTDKVFRLKENAQVMMLNNDQQKRWVNGSIGRIIMVEPEGETIIVQLLGGKTVDVTPYEWDIFRYVYDEDTDQIDTEQVGSFKQYPLRLSWAVTIHKAQGKTFDNVILDIGAGAFTPGQVYVGLSRCVSLEGLVLKKKIRKQDIFIDWNVVKFMTGYRYAISEKEMPVEKKIEIIKDAIKKKSELEIIYLKKNDEKSMRVILPECVGKMEFMGKSFTGIRAFCRKSNEERTFRADRILSLRLL